MDYLRDIRELHYATIAPYTGKPRGCTLAQVAALEARLGFSLPCAYVQFLLWMSHDTQGMFVGSDCFINHVEQNTRYLSKLLESNCVRFELPPQYLAFFSHQGYQLLWFPLPAQSDDPICWGFCEGHTSEPTAMGKFTEWLRECTETLGPLLARTGRRA
jgi:hypothetical protein